MIKRRLSSGIFIFLAGIYPCLFCAYNLHYLLLRTPRLTYSPAALSAGAAAERNILMFFGIFMLLVLAFAAYTVVISMTIGSNVYDVVGAERRRAEPQRAQGLDR